jgi:hypothetical protein
LCAAWGLLLPALQEEVPLLGMFRKEQAGSLLAMRKDDEPAKAQAADINNRFPAGTIQPKHRRIRRWNVLWAVHDMALRYFALRQRMITRFAVSGHQAIALCSRRQRVLSVGSAEEEVSATPRLPA